MKKIDFSQIREGDFVMCEVVGADKDGSVFGRVVPININQKRLEFIWELGDRKVAGYIGKDSPFDEGYLSDWSYDKDVAYYKFDSEVEMISEWGLRCL